ncbi:2-methylcitrate dehydratase [Rhizodiscina lignyota]|uniref:2-methylcitrate dehydratase n=1 Tax=Rhizodiscina lignyota TaxID=1504668 RepID=A0A9P4I9V5_9PEZI|nr:2-methylcitrate dehydratase [Rhizodiscina lignyota]
MSGNQTSSANGEHTNGATTIPVTKILTEWVASAKPSLLTPELRSRLRDVIADFIAVSAGAASTVDSSGPIYKAIVAFSAGAKGPCTVMTKGNDRLPPQYAALLNACFGHSMDFDDTYAPGSLHAGVTVIATALAQAEVLGDSCSIEDFQVGIAVGYEIVCRLGRELGREAYARGFHNTSTCGIFGAVSTIAVMKHLDAKTIDMAFGIAGSKAAGSMQYLDNGSWNKRLHPAFAAHDAFMSVALAEAGVIGSTRSIEGTMGFLNGYSPRPNKDLVRLTSGLGTEWEFLKSALKPFPACRMTHVHIEMADNLAQKRKGENVKKVTIYLSAPNMSLVGEPTPNKIHPENVIDGQFSAYYQYANSYIYGSQCGMATYEASRLKDKDIHNLCAKTTCVVDPKIPDFGSRVLVEYDNGDMAEDYMEFPLGEPEHPYTVEQAHKKFDSLLKPVYGDKQAAAIWDAVEKLDGSSGGVKQLMSLLA